MKKLLCVVLCLAMLALLGCGSAESSATNGKTAPGCFMAGYAKVNITPEDSVPLGGYGNSLNRMSTGFIDYIYATCLALRDGEGNTVVIMGVDMGGTGGEIHNIRAKIHQQLGLPEENVIIAASHMHSFADLTISEDPSIARYIPVLTQAMLDVAEAAVADLAPAEAWITDTQTEGLNFVRRYELEGGIFVGYESDITESGKAIVGHETEADGQLQLVKFTREEKTDILLANYQVHPHRGAGSSSTLITADLVGAFRDEVTAKLGYDVVYITGAAGNLNPYSMISEENITKDFKEQGKALARYAIDADGTYTQVETGTIRAVGYNYEGKVDHSTDGMLNSAQEALNYYKQTNSVAMLREKYLSQGIHSPNHANQIVARAGSGATNTFRIFALSVGDIGFAVAPYEMFDTNGMYIKENSPYKMTVITTCANGAYGYIPTELAIEHGGYEPDNTRYAAGTAEELAQLYVQLLTELK